MMLQFFGDIGGKTFPVHRESGAGGDATQRLTLAVGPEGGWTDAEVEMLEANGFARYSLGGRILRTDTALIALLARLSP